VDAVSGKTAAFVRRVRNIPTARATTVAADLAAAIVASAAIVPTAIRNCAPNTSEGARAANGVNRPRIRIRHSPSLPR
jgi:hypothetical protein